MTPDAQPVVNRAVPLLLVFFAACSGPSGSTPERPWLAAAVSAANWLEEVAIRRPDGLVWPVAPSSDAEPYRDRFSDDLYSGNAGVVLALLELSRVTGEGRFRDLALRGAEHLLVSLEHPENQSPGLYSGTAGIGFVLLRVGEETGESRFTAGGARAVEILQERAVPAGSGVEWTPVTDIVSGSSGTGLFLLDAGRRLDDPRAFALAAAAGRRLLELAIPTAEGLQWRMSPSTDRLMPNFSHGTAGIAYFLASLYLETREEAFLRAAEDGAAHLLAIGDISETSCRIHHHSPGGEDLYYLSWCHGPAGTGRLFYRLYQASGDRSWLGWLRRSAAAIEDSGIPEQRTPGFWNNIGPCCGSAGTASFLLNVDRVLEEKRRTQLTLRLTEDLLERATPAGEGLKWVQAEHRVRPELLAAQTGYMQGAAGVLLWMLELDAALNGETGPVPLPDSPFGAP